MVCVTVQKIKVEVSQVHFTDGYTEAQEDLGLCVSATSTGHGT